MKVQFRKVAALVGLGLLALGTGGAYAAGTYDSTQSTTWEYYNWHEVTGTRGNAEFFGGAGPDSISYVSNGVKAHSAGILEPELGGGPDNARLEFYCWTKTTRDWVWEPDPNNPSSAPWIQPQYGYPLITGTSNSSSTPTPSDPGATATSDVDFEWWSDRGHSLRFTDYSHNNSSMSNSRTSGITVNDGPYYRGTFQTVSDMAVSPMLLTYTSDPGAVADTNHSLIASLDQVLLNASDTCPEGASCSGGSGGSSSSGS